MPPGRTFRGHNNRPVGEDQRVRPGQARWPAPTAACGRKAAGVAIVVSGAPVSCRSEAPRGWESPALGSRRPLADARGDNKGSRGAARAPLSWVATGRLAAAGRPRGCHSDGDCSRAGTVSWCRTGTQVGVQRSRSLVWRCTRTGCRSQADGPWAGWCRSRLSSMARLPRRGTTSTSRPSTWEASTGGSGPSLLSPWVRKTG